MKGKKLRRSILAVLLAGTLAVTPVVMAGCSSQNTSSSATVTQTADTCLMPAAMQTQLKSLQDKTYTGADYEKALLYEILGVSERTLTEDTLNQLQSAVTAAGAASQEDATIAAEYSTLINQMKTLNNQLNALRDTLNTTTDAAARQAQILNTKPADVTSIIQKIDSLAFYGTIDELSLKGNLKVDCESLKTAITADLIVALAVTYLQDPATAATDAQLLLNTLTTQWVAVSNSNGTTAEGVTEVSSLPTETTMTAEELEAYCPSGGIFSGILTDAEVQTLSDTGTVSTGTNQVAAVDADTAVAATDSNSAKGYNTYLANLLTENKKTYGDLLAKKASDVPDKWAKAKLNTKDGVLTVVRKKNLQQIASSSDGGKGIAALEAAMTEIYPGAVLYANQNLAEGNPVTMNTLKRESVTLTNSLGVQSQTVAGDKVSTAGVTDAINKQIDEYKQSEQTGKVQSTYTDIVQVESSTQLSTKLGFDTSKWGIDFEAISGGTKQYTVIFVQQIYYTIKVETATADGLFQAGQTDALKNAFNTGNDGKNLGGVLVKQVNYGRIAAVVLESDSTSSEVNLAWNSAYKGTTQNLTAKQQDILKNTHYTVYLYGGSAGAASGAIQAKDMTEVKKYLAQDSGYDPKTITAVPVSYIATNLTTGEQAAVVTTTDYIQTTTEEHAKVSFEVNSAKWYMEKTQEFMGRKITSINEETGELVLGPWETLKSWGSGDMKLQVPGTYAEFGYSFDIRGGTDWPYSDVFWRTSNGIADKIYIGLRGTCRCAGIRIVVNDREVYNQSNCDSHDRRDWSKI